MIRSQTASPTIILPPFKPLTGDAGSSTKGEVVAGNGKYLERKYKALEDRLERAEGFITRLTMGIQDQLKSDGNAIPAWLIPLLGLIPPASVPRIDPTSGHTIGRAIYSPRSQKVVISGVMKVEDVNSLGK